MIINFLTSLQSSQCKDIFEKIKEEMRLSYKEIYDSNGIENFEKALNIFIKYFPTEIEISHKNLP